MQCNGIINNWLHSMTSDSKGWFLVNVWVSMMSGHDANPIFLNKKNQNWTSRALANPQPPKSDNISFLLYINAYLWVICWTVNYRFKTGWSWYSKYKNLLQNIWKKQIYLIKSASITIEKIEYCENKGT